MRLFCFLELLAPHFVTFFVRNSASQHQIYIQALFSQQKMWSKNFKMSFMRGTLKIKGGPEPWTPRWIRLWCFWPRWLPPCLLHSVVRPGITRYRSSLFRVHWLYPKFLHWTSNMAAVTSYENHHCERVQVSELNFHIWNCQLFARVKREIKMAAHREKFCTSVSVFYSDLYVSSIPLHDFSY